MLETEYFGEVIVLLWILQFSSIYITTSELQKRCHLLLFEKREEKGSSVTLSFLLPLHKGRGGLSAFVFLMFIWQKLLGIRIILLYILVSHSLIAVGQMSYGG